MKVEADRQMEIRRDFEEGALLVPVVMRLVLSEEVDKMLTWGDNHHWMATILSEFGISSILSCTRVMDIVKAGKGRVWGKGEDNLESVASNVIVRSRYEEEIGNQKRYLIGLAVRATVMAVVGSNWGEYGNKMALVRFMQENPDVFDEILMQLEVEIDDRGRERILNLLRTIEL